MNEDVRLAKNERIRIKGKATREGHEKMRAVTVSLKLSLDALIIKNALSSFRTSSNVAGFVIIY